MEGLRAPPSDRPFVTPAACRPRSWLGLGAPGAGEGLLLQAAQATTTDTGNSGGSRAGRTACRSPCSCIGTAGAGPGSHPRSQAPRQENGFRAPAAPARSRRSWSRRHLHLDRYRHGSGRQAPTSTSRAQGPWRGLAVTCHVPIRSGSGNGAGRTAASQASGAAVGRNPHRGRIAAGAGMRTVCGRRWVSVVSIAVTPYKTQGGTVRAAQLWCHDNFLYGFRGCQSHATASSPLKFHARRSLAPVCLGSKGTRRAAILIQMDWAEANLQGNPRCLLFYIDRVTRNGQARNLLGIMVRD